MVKFDYADYFFYKLVCLTHAVDLSYVGKTNNWGRRKRLHKSCCNNPKSDAYNNKKYRVIRENGGWDNWIMVEIDFREHLTEEEARVIEEEYRVELQAHMNDRGCHSTPEQQAEYNRQGQRRYYQNHKEELKEPNDCPICSGKYSTRNKARHLKSRMHQRALSNAPSSSTDNASPE